MKPAPFHPWGYQSAHSKREDFASDADYWRYWVTRLSLSTNARLRLEWMIFYFTIGKKNTTKTAAHFGISRRIFIKWKTRFRPHDLTSLSDQSKTPKKKREWTVTAEEEHNVIAIRKQRMKWGKEKLRREYQRVYGRDISTNKIAKVITKHQLYPDPETRKQRQKQAQKRRVKTYITTFETKNVLGYLWHTDAIIIWWYGSRRVIFTGIEEQTKIGYARVYPTNSSAHAKDFLQRLVYLSNHQVKHIHHDNGSEFYGDFEEACQQLGIPQIFSRVRTPKDNAALERFNRTVQDEWLSLSEVGLDDLSWANEDLTTWLIDYNDHRPHQSLAYKTPLAYATETFQLSPMWAASTSVCYVMVYYRLR